jgi:hypothetical protein
VGGALPAVGGSGPRGSGMRKMGRYQCGPTDGMRLVGTL